ncbi:hypothetical protein [Anabaena sp. CCY 9402-a]
MMADFVEAIAIFRDNGFRSPQPEVNFIIFNITITSFCHFNWP